MNASTFTDTTVTNIEVYTYSIQTYDEVPNYSSGISRTVDSYDITPPMLVQNLSALAGAEQTITLNWQNPPDADFAGVKIVRSSQFTVDSSQIILEGNAASYLDSNLTQGRDYTYSVLTYDSFSNYSSAVSIFCKARDIVSPDSVNDFKGKVSSYERNASLTWVNPAQPDFTGIRIGRQTGDSIMPQYIYPGKVNSYVDTGLINETTYTYTINAYDEVPNYSSAVSIQLELGDITPPGPVTNLNIVKNLGGYVELAWENPLDPDLDGIKICKNFDTSLTGYWNMDEGTGVTILNNAGNNNGHIYGAGWDSGYTGKGLRFDGLSDYVNINSFNPMLNNKVTMMAWIKWDGIGNYVITKGSDYSANSYGIAVSYSGPFIMTGNSNRGMRWAVDYSYLLKTNKWHHITGVVDGSESRIYLDGILRGTASNIGTINESPNSFWIGGQDRPGYSYNFKGLVDEVKTYNRSLSLEEIKEEYNKKNVETPVVFDETKTSLVELNLMNGKSYVYTLYSYDGAPNYSQGAKIAVTPSGNPLDITNLKLTGGDERVTLEWEKPRTAGEPGSPEFSNARIIRSIVPQFETSAQILVYEGADSTFTDTGLINNLNYFYSIFSKDNSGNYSGPVIGKCMPYDSTAPGEIMNLNILAGDGKVELTWGNLSDPDFRGVKINKEHGAEGMEQKEIIYTGMGASFTDTAVTNGIIYTYTIQAYDEMPNYSQGVTGTALPWEYNPPSGVSEFKGGPVNSGVSLNWKNPGNNDLMGVQISRQSSVNSSQWDLLTAIDYSLTTYLDTSADKCKVVYYRAVAYDSLLNYSDTSEIEFIGKLTDITVFSSTGIKASAVNFVDMDNDSDLDFVFLQQASRNKIYRNDGGVFRDITDTSGIKTTSGYQAGLNDFDNDGDVDLFIPIDGWSDFIYKNNGRGEFIETGAVKDYYYGGLSSISDIDNDSDLDIMVSGSNRLYINDGKGNFTLIEAGDRGITSSGSFGLFTDFDKDGDIDFAGNISNSLNRGIKIYSNEGGVFKDKTGELGLSDFSPCGWYSNRIYFIDFNNDGYSDLFQAADASNFMRVYCGAGANNYSPVHKFEEVTNEIGLSGISSVNDIQSGDLDNDGDMDLVLGCKGAQNKVYENVNGFFADVTGKFGISSANKDCNQVKLADIDKDGDLDIYFANSSGGILLRNNLDDQKFLEISLNCRTSNRFGIGTQIVIRDSLSVIRGYKEINEPGLVHFGLGDLEMVDVYVKFPSGLEVVIKDVTAGRFLTVEEPYYIAPITDFKAVGRDERIDLAWKNPVSGNYQGTILLRSNTNIYGLNYDSIIQNPDSSTRIIYNGTDTLFIDSCVTNDTVYYYAGFSYDTADIYSLPGISNYLSAVSHDFIPPGPVTDFIAKPGAGHIVLSWANPVNNDFAGVKISRQSSVNGSQSELLSTIYYSLTTYTDTTVSNGITYTYEMQSFDEMPNYSQAVSISAAPAILNDLPASPVLETQGKGVKNAVVFPSASGRDYDNDGKEDIFLACSGRDYLYRNLGDGNYETVSGPWDNAGDESWGASAGDINNDGRVDLFVCNNGQPSVLYLNTDSATADKPGWVKANGLWDSCNDYSISAALFDADNDGDLDIYLVNWYGENKFYENTGANSYSPVPSFEEKTKESGLGHPGYGVKAVAFDYDKDGDQDVYLVNYTSSNILYENDGTGRFKDVTEKSGLADNDHSWDVAVGDYNNDGYPDLYVVNWWENNKLYTVDSSQLTEGKIAFKDVALELGLTGKKQDISAVFFDMNLDGNEDLYVVNWWGESRIYENQSSVDSLQLTEGKFKEIKQGVKKTLQAAKTDYDNDGDEDLYLVNWDGNNNLYNNMDELGGQKWLKIDLNGSVSNRFGIGSKINVGAGLRTCPKEVTDTNPVCFGLGNMDSVSVNVVFPSGAAVNLNGIAKDQVLTVTEPDIVPSPTKLMAKGENGKVELTWQSPSGFPAVWQEIRLFKDTVLIYSGLDTTYTDYNVVNGISYNYSIYAYDLNSGNSSILLISAKSNICPQDNIPPEQIINPKIIIGNGKLTLSWQNQDNNIAGVKIIRKKDKYADTFNEQTLIYNGIDDNYVDTSLINENTYYYSFFSYDSRYNYSEAVNRKAAPDGISPDIEIKDIINNKYYSTAVYPQISISDLNLSYSTVTLKFNNSSDSAYVSGTEIKKDGRYLLFVSAFDSAENLSYESANFTIDKTKPSISISGVNNNTYYSTDVWFKVKISETNPVKEEILLDGTIYLENETVWVKDEVLHKLTVDTLDKAGNANKKEYSFTIDKTIPRIEVNNCGEGGYYLSSVRPEILIADINLDTGSIRVELNGSSFISGNEIRTGGSYELKINAADYSMNTAQVDLHFVLDSTNPEITITGVGEGGYYSTAVYPQVYITDINLENSMVELNDSVYISGREIKPDGRYKLFADAYDSVGNKSEKEINFTVDKSKPAINITGVNNNTYYSTDVWFKVKISETNPVKEEITLDGTIYLENETVWVYDEGNHKLIVDALDKAGNENMKEYDFTIDNTKPLIIVEGLENLPEGQYYSTFVTPRVSVLDANIDSSSISITLNGNVFTNGTDIKEDGDYILGVLAGDYALNKSEKDIHFKLMLNPRLRVITLPGEAAIYLDGDYSYPGKYQGATGEGAEGALLIEKNISAGKHLLRVKKPGYMDYMELINFNIGELVERDIDLKPWGKEYFNEGELLALDPDKVSLRPWVTDYDQDGKKDLVARTSDGKDYLYLNTGADNDPKYDSSVLINDDDETFYEIYYETNHDSRFTIHGSSDGRIYFDSSVIILADSAELDVGGHSWPFVVDFDHDGRDDLISGGQKGEIYFFKNIGTRENPVFDTAQMVQTGKKNLDAGSYSRPFVVDWNNDGLSDLLIGTSEGIYVYPAVDKMIDDTAPITAAETAPPVFPDKWFNNDVKINFTAIDDLSGFDTIGGTYCLVNGELWTVNSIKKDTETIETEIVISQEGNFVLSYYSADDAGNREKTQSIKINIDKTPPLIGNIVLPDINEHTVNSVKISADINDGLSGLDTTRFQYSLDQDTTWINFKTLKLGWQNLAGRIIRFRAYAKDKAGNERYSEERTEFIENINDSPGIISYEPEAKSLRINEGEKIDFKAAVFDPDNDTLRTVWYFDSTVASEGLLEWACYADYDGSGAHEIKFKVMDSSFSVEEVWKLEVDDVAVRPPLNLIVKTGMGGCVFLRWDENKYFNLLGYNVYRDNAKINKTLVTRDNYSDTGLVDGGQYAYFIRAVDFNGKESENSNEVLVIPEDLSAPSAPSNLDINNSGLLSWEKPPFAEALGGIPPLDYDVAGYYLYQGIDTNNLDNKIFAGGYLPVRQAGNHTPSYQLNNLLPGTQYYFAVSAYDNSGKESEKSNIVSFLFNDTQPPSQIKNIRIRDTGKTGELKIKWQKNNEPDLAGYKLYYGLNPSEYNIPVFVGMKEKFVLSGLNDFSKYFIAVSGVDTQGNEGLKSFEEIGIPRGNSAFIPCPEPLIIDNINRGVKLRWNVVSEIDGYKVYFGKSEDLVLAPLITSETTFIFNNLSNNNKYYAAVSSFNGKDESERVSGIVLPKDESAPDAPAGLTCLSGSDGTRLILSWSLNKEWDLAGYKIACKVGSEYFSEPKIIEKINTFDISGLKEGEQYFIALFAFDTENNTSNPSIISGIPLKTNYTFNAPPSAPMLDISCENGSVRLNWISSDENIGEYRIYRREAGESKYSKIYQTKNMTYRNTAVEEGKTYYYVVTAFSENSFPKESIFSNEVVMRPRLKLGDIEIEGEVPVEGRVDGYDLIMLSISFGARIGEDYYNPNADINGDGVIDGIDLGILANNFGKQY